jgi:Icc protein
VCDALLSRRQLMRYGALVAATFPAGAVLLSQRAAHAGPAVPMHLELVTVTDTSAVITWFTGDPTAPDEFGRPEPVAAPGRVLIGTTPDPSSWVPVGEHEPTPYHYVEVTGLKPGTTYWWRAESGGLPATMTTIANPLLRPTDAPVAAPPTFTTMVPPPGRELGRVAWLNDLHFGEGTSGLALSNDMFPGGGIPPGFAADPDDPYWRFMSQAAVAEAKARGCTLLLANGDVTAEARPAEVEEARRMLDGFGALGGVRHLGPGDDAAYFVTRGNHDRAHTGDLYAACSGSEAKDCYRDAFAASYEPGTSHFSVTVGTGRARYRFVGLDSNDGEATGVFPAGELDYLAEQLAQGDATIPLFHHPASDLAEVLTVPPFVGSLDQADAKAFRDLIARSDNVAGVYAGHTHRNIRARASETGDLPFFEGGAVKEYPGGYTVVRLYETGYLVNFYKTAAPECRAWSERSRGEYLGLYPYYTLGGLGDRNWSYDVDARVRRPAFVVPPETPVPADRPPPGGGSLPATGADAAVAVAGAAAVVGGVALTRALAQP